jgi:hypothetical protein
MKICIFVEPVAQKIRKNSVLSPEKTTQDTKETNTLSLCKKY